MPMVTMVTYRRLQSHLTRAGHPLLEKYSGAAAATVRQKSKR